MPQDSAAIRYSRVAILLHWLLAALIIANLAIGLTHEDMAREARRFWMDQHMAIGLTVLFLTLVRIGWRLCHRPPPLSEALAPWERFLARAVHSLFYIFLIGVPLLGWLIVSTGRGGDPVNIFGLFEIPALPTGPNQSAHERIEQLHELFAKIWIGLIALHILGALKHQFVDRDATLARMIPFLAR